MEENKQIHLSKIALYAFPIRETDMFINSSLFCVKLMTTLTVLKIPFEVKYDTFALGKTPKGKLPFIVDGNNQLFFDSRLIIEKLKENGKDLDMALSKVDQSISITFRRMLEEHLYWYIVATRWERNWDYVATTYFYFFPWFMYPVKLWIKRQFINQLYGVGVSRLEVNEQLLLSTQDLTALEELLQSSQTHFFFSSTTCTNLDIVAFSSTFSILSTPFEDPLKSYIVKTCPHLVKLVSLMLKTLYMKEYEHYKHLFASQHSK